MSPQPQEQEIDLSKIYTHVPANKKRMINMESRANKECDPPQSPR